MPVPIAIIVCEGDIETIAHISEALENKLPVIIMKGSGKAADLVFDFLQKYVIKHKIFWGFLVKNLYEANILLIIPKTE